MSSTTWAESPERPERPAQAGGPPGDGPPTDAGTTAPSGAPQSWFPWSAPVALVSALIVAILGGLIVTVIAAAFGAGEVDDPAPGVLMGATFVQDIGFVASAIIFAKMAGPVWAQQFGLRRTSGFWAGVGWVALLYVAFAAFGALWQLLVEIEEDDVLDQLGADDSDVALAFALLLVCVAAPVVEEFFFRGFFFTALRNWKGVWPAAIITGIVFGGIHVGGSPIGAIVPLMVFGFGLCLLYERTRSLYPCIAVHAINNAIAFSVLNEWDWQVPLVVLGSLAACFAIAIPASRRWPPPDARPEPAPGV